MRARNGVAALSLLLLIPFVAPPPADGQSTVRLAFFNIQSGKGEVGLPGRPVFFADTQNCADPTRPVNAWGVGFVQEALVAALRDDPSIVALGLAEAWVCGSAENVRKLLGWAARSSERNGVALVARYGFAGPEAWQQLDTSLNPNPADTMWVVRVPVCTDAACARSILAYAAHWYSTGSVERSVYDRQAEQTIEFMTRTSSGAPHVLIGDLNAWEDTAPRCGKEPINAGVPKLRAAGYIDAWPRIHGAQEGLTGMTNRAGCGVPEGYTWKRIDYAWSSPGLEPIDVKRFAVPEVAGDAAASDHYGIIATYPLPGVEPPDDMTPPAVHLIAPAAGVVVRGSIDVEVAATDAVGVTRVEVLADTIVRRTLTAAPYRTMFDTTTLPNGMHAFQARAFDAAGNMSASSVHTVQVDNAIVSPPDGDIVLYARRANRIAGAWQLVSDASAAGGAAMTNPNANLAKLTAPVAAPASYFELTFTPAAGRAYRLWLRGRAASDHWSNDSVFVQFSGSVTAAGAAASRIGTTAAATVNLEDGANAGLSGWGWQDNGYGAGVLGSIIYFDGALQIVRVQPREDGISIDQIVLSSVTYLSSAPGALKQDTTILAETTAKATLDEVLVRASAPALVKGGWRVVSDATAADGVALTHPDAGAAKVSSALASPVNYVELTFHADAGKPYRLWLRGRADRDSWANDSVFVQFSGAVDAAGVAVYRIGTTQALSVNLEDASGAGLSAWGWQDTGYGTNVLGPTIRFASAGPQTVRIQTREDGLRFDQFVMSSAKYLTAAPGGLKNDTTILK